MHAISGAVAGMVAITVFYPLDTARTRLQVDDQREAKHSQVVLSDWSVRRMGACCHDTLLIKCCLLLLVEVPQDGGVVRHNETVQRGYRAPVGFPVRMCQCSPDKSSVGRHTRLRLQGAKFRTKNYRDRRALYVGIHHCCVKIGRHEGCMVL